MLWHYIVVIVVLSLAFTLCLQHDHPYISAMVNNGSLHYDHDRDGTHGQMDGCTVSQRLKPALVVA